MGDVPDHPPTSLSKAIKEGGGVFASWLNHQTLLSQPREYLPPPDTRVPWNKSHVAMKDNNGPSIARIYYIARAKKVTGVDVHTRSTEEVLHVSPAALKYNITDHVLMMSRPKKVYPADENEPWRLKNNKGKYKLAERLEIISRPRKTHPSTDRPASEIGHPPRAALYGSPPYMRAESAPPKKAASAPPKKAAPPPPPPPPAAKPSAVKAEVPPAATSSSTGPTTSTTDPTTSTTDPSEPTGTTSTSDPTGPTSSSGVTSSTSGSSTGAGVSSSESSPSAEVPAG